MQPAQIEGPICSCRSGTFRIFDFHPMPPTDVNALGPCGGDHTNGSLLWCSGPRDLRRHSLLGNHAIQSNNANVGRKT